MAVNNGVHRVRERKQQSFDRMVPQYFLNAQGSLEESPIQKDMQALIDSAEYTNLDELYDRFLSMEQEKWANIVEGEELVTAREGFESKLEMMLETQRLMDDIVRENPDLAGKSLDEMKKHLHGKINDANKAIEDAKKPKEKESKPHEEKNEPKSE